VDCIHLAVGGAGSCEHGNEISGSIKDGGLLNERSDFQLLKEGYVSWNFSSISSNASINVL
jgi:hypothetical protein